MTDERPENAPEDVTNTNTDTYTPTVNNPLREAPEAVEHDIRAVDPASGEEVIENIPPKPEYAPTVHNHGENSHLGQDAEEQINIPPKPEYAPYYANESQDRPDDGGSNIDQREDMSIPQFGNPQGSQPSQNIYGQPQSNQSVDNVYAPKNDNGLHPTYDGYGSQNNQAMSYAPDNQPTPDVQAYPAQTYTDQGYANQGYVSGPGTNTMALLSMIVSLASILFGGLFSIIGVILGHIALKQIKISHEEGRGMALIGLVAGYIQLGLIVLGALGFLVIMAFAIITGNS